MLKDDLSIKEFLDAADNMKKLKSKPADSELLALYGLYKQATVGDVNTARPRLLDLAGKIFLLSREMSLAKSKLNFVSHGRQEQVGRLELAQGNLHRRCREGLRREGQRARRQVRLELSQP